MSFEILRKVESQMFYGWIEEKLGKDMIGKDAILKKIFVYGLLSAEISILQRLTNEAARNHKLDILIQLGANHVCVILSHRRDTSFEASFRHRKKYLADVLSLDPCNALCIHSKIPFQIIF